MFSDHVQSARTRITVICVYSETVLRIGVLGDLEVVFGDDLVEGICSATEGFAGIAVALQRSIELVEVREGITRVKFIP